LEYEIKAGPQGHFYIPKRIRETLGTELKVIPNAKAAIFFPSNVSLEDVLQSLKIIRLDLEHRLKMQQKGGAFK
jgi:hypothetical protein